MRRPQVLLVSCLIAASSAAMAGAVEVRFIAPQNYSDAGTVPSQKEAALRAIGRQLEGLGLRLLPANQTLKVEVLDVVLAGTERVLQGDTRVRVTRGGADFPRIKLRYTLEQAGQPVRSGEEWLADLDYSRGVLSVYASDPLYYEKHMLDKWFKERFVEGRPAAS
jgi:hypothetical protein